MTNEPFAVHLTRQAEKDSDDLKPYQRRVIEALLALEDDPDAGHVLLILSGNSVALRVPPCLRVHFGV